MAEKKSPSDIPYFHRDPPHLDPKHNPCRTGSGFTLDFSSFVRQETLPEPSPLERCAAAFVDAARMLAEREDDRVGACSPGSGSSAYRRLDVESKAPRKENDRFKKKKYSFDKSLVRLLKQGYTRHLFAREAFSIMADALDEGDELSVPSLARDLTTGGAEWVSTAMRREGDVLVCYEHPRNIVFLDTGVPSTSRYDCSRIKSDQQIRFNIEGLESGIHYPMGQVSAVCPSLVIYLCARPFHELSARLQTMTYVRFPKENITAPMVIMRMLGDAKVYIDCVAHQSGSRGVRKRR